MDRTTETRGSDPNHPCANCQHKRGVHNYVGSTVPEYGRACPTIGCECDGYVPLAALGAREGEQAETQRPKTCDCGHLESEHEIYDSSLGDNVVERVTCRSCSCIDFQAAEQEGEQAEGEPRRYSAEPEGREAVSAADLGQAIDGVPPDLPTPEASPPASDEGLREAVKRLLAVTELPGTRSELSGHTERAKSFARAALATPNPKEQTDAE